MKYFLSISLLSLLFFITSCSSSRKTAVSKAVPPKTEDIKSTVKIKKNVPVVIINTKNISADKVVDYAEKQVGVKYKYGSSKKENGFDCSGFITYVFSHFDIPVPRISKDFTNTGDEVAIQNCRRGDIILFTGSDANSGEVGHMGIITSIENGFVNFIHASTSKGVMISGMNSYFIPRFVKVNRLFKIP